MEESSFSPNPSPAAPVAAPRPSANRVFWVGLAVLTVLRAWFVQVSPLDLSGDEAYYWDWGRRLSFGYFSKPPLVAWLARLAGEIGGHHETSLRWMATVLTSASLACTYTLGRRMFDARTGLLAAALTAACPGNVALAYVLTIDPPLILCWSAALLATWCALDPATNRRAVWAVAAVVTVGCGLLAKQMMLAFLPAVALFLALHPAGRRELRRPWFWVAGVGAHAFLLPTLWWNARHDWITFTHTRHHFDSDGATWGDVADHLGQFLGSQLGTLSPVTWVLVAAVAAAGAIRPVRLDRRALFLWCLSAPGLGVFALLALRQHINGNWPAAFYPAGLLLVAAWARGDVRLRLRRWSAGPRWALAVGAALTLLVYAAPFVLESERLRGGESDFTRRLKGWERYGHSIEEIRRRQPRPDQTFLLVVGHRYHASQLAFYAPGQPRVHRWAPPGRVESQYELWGLPRDREGHDALIVVHEEADWPAALGDRFVEVRSLGTTNVSLGHSRRSYHLFLGRHWQAVDDTTAIAHGGTVTR